MALILHDQPSTRQWPKPLCAVEGKRGRTAVLYYFVVFLFVLLPHWHTEHLDGKQSARTLGLREFFFGFNCFTFCTSDRPSHLDMN